MFAGPIVGLCALLGAGDGSDAPATAVASCQTSGPVAGLSAVQARNAREIVSSAQQVTLIALQDLAAQQRAELIALMTAGTESTLHVYPNPSVPASEQLPNDGPPPSGGDHDSIGLFQQRASWGSVAERMDASSATRLFVTRLLALPSWETLAPGVAAQVVQHSSYPDMYAATQTDALGWLRQIDSSAAAAQCGADGLPKSAVGSIPPGTIPPHYLLPSTATDAERRAVTFALAQLGKPYVFGATGPQTYDCSGLTMAAWSYAGVQLPHYTVGQYQVGVAVAGPSLLSPGDLIFIPGSDGSLNPPNPQHVGMYIGDGYVIEAPETNEVVKIVPLGQFTPIIGIRRYG